MSLKLYRQRAADFRHELGELTRARAAIGEAVLRRPAGQRQMTEAERDRFLALGPQIDDLKAQIEDNSIALRAAEEANEAIRHLPSDGSMSPDTAAQVAGQRRAGISVSAGDFSMTTATRPQGRTFQELFPRVAVRDGGYGSLDDVIGSVLSGRHDPRMLAAAQEGATPSLGQFAVPTAYASQILQPLLESSLVLSRATIWPMTTKAIQIPAFAADGGSDGPYGVAPQWIPEDGETEMDAKTFRLRALKLEAHSLALYVEISNALLQDGVGFGAQLEAAMRGSCSWHLDREFLTGTGAGRPLGFIGSSNPSRIVIPRGAASHITYDDTLNMLSRLSAASFANATWVASQTALPELLALSVAIGTAGSFLPAVLNRDGAMTLHTRPLIISEKVANVGTEGDLCLVDFAAYQVGLRSDISLDFSPHVAFSRNAGALRLIIRVDGQPGLATPYTPPGGTTQSPFIVLGDAA